MKDLTQFMQGNDFAKKSQRFKDKVQEIKEAYEGNFDTSFPMYTMPHNERTGIPTLTVDEDVPLELNNAIHKVFKEVWR